jgi:hypothetical protein
VKACTATLISIVGVLGVSAVAAIVNAQVLDTGDDSRTQIPIPATSTAPVEPSDPTSTVVIDAPTSADPIPLPTDAAALATDTTETAVVATVAAEPIPPVNVSSIAPLPTELSSQPAIPVPGALAGSGTSDDDHTGDDDDHTGEASEDRSDDDD